MPSHPFRKEILPDIQPKSSPVQLEPVASHPFTCPLRKETNTSSGSLLSGTDRGYGGLPLGHPFWMAAQSRALGMVKGEQRGDANSVEPPQRGSPAARSPRLDRRTPGGCRGAAVCSVGPRPPGGSTATAVGGLRDPRPPLRPRRRAMGSARWVLSSSRGIVPRFCSSPPLGCACGK